MNGFVKMYRTLDSANNGSLATWVVEKPDGSILDTSGSATQGLQEAMDYASHNGFNLRKYGGGIASKNGQDTSILYVNAQVVVPPLQGATWILDGTINFGGSPAGYQAAFVIDSLMSSNLFVRGQIVTDAYWETGVLIKPTLELPQDGAGPVMTSSKLHLASVSMSAPDAICIDLDATLGGINGCEFNFIEPNSNQLLGTTNVRVQAGDGTVFCGNRLNVMGAHGARKATIDNGGSGALPMAEHIYGNEWFVSMHPGTDCIGLEDYSWQDQFTLSITNQEGQPSVGIQAPSGITSDCSRYRVLRNNATIPFAMR